MENIIKNPGLQHLAEKVLRNLDVENLNKCVQINQSCKQIVDNARFWLTKFTSLSKENQRDWIKAIKQVKNSDKEEAIISYLQWILKGKVVDLPCYSIPAVQDSFKKKIMQMIIMSGSDAVETVKILAPLTYNPNAPDKFGKTPIYYAAYNGHKEIIRILASLTDNPNAPDEDGVTPIHMAARKGNTEIVKILAP